MNFSEHYVGVVPCAGASRRMGTAKAMLRLGGETFLRRVVTALDRGGCQGVLVVVPGVDAQGATTIGASILANEAAAAGARVVTNEDPGEGPITSLRLAIRAAGDEARGIVYLPVDHPRVDAGLVRTVLESAVSSGAPLTVPMVGEKRGHPAVFDRRLFPELLDPTLEGGARTVVHRHLDEACLLTVETDAAITDVDTPAEYDQLVRAFPPTEPETS